MMQHRGAAASAADQGGVPDSIIMEEEYDPDYEPTEEEIIEYAIFLGMDYLGADAPLLWIAKEGLKAPLPEPWKPCKTGADDVYYFNFETGESVWDHPCDQYYKKLFEEERAKLLGGGGGVAMGMGFGGARSRLDDEDDSDERIIVREKKKKKKKRRSKGSIDGALDTFGDLPPAGSFSLNKYKPLGSIAAPAAVGKTSPANSAEPVVEGAAIKKAEQPDVVEKEEGLSAPISRPTATENAASAGATTGPAKYESSATSSPRGASQQLQQQLEEEWSVARQRTFDAWKASSEVSFQQDMARITAEYNRQIAAKEEAAQAALAAAAALSEQRQRENERTKNEIENTKRDREALKAARDQEREEEQRARVERIRREDAEKAKIQAEMAKIEEERNELREACAREIENIKKQHEEQVKTMKEQVGSEKASAEQVTQLERDLESAKRRAAAGRATHDLKIRELKEQIESIDSKLQTTKTELIATKAKYAAERESTTAKVEHLQAEIQRYKTEAAAEVEAAQKAVTDVAAEAAKEAAMKQAALRAHVDSLTAANEELADAAQRAKDLSAKALAQKQGEWEEARRNLEAELREWKTRAAASAAGGVGVANGSAASADQPLTVRKGIAPDRFAASSPYPAVDENDGVHTGRNNNKAPSHPSRVRPRRRSEPDSRFLTRADIEYDMDEEDEDADGYDESLGADQTRQRQKRHVQRDARDGGRRHGGMKKGHGRRRNKGWAGDPAAVIQEDTAADLSEVQYLSYRKERNRADEAMWQSRTMGHTPRGHVPAVEDPWVAKVHAERDIINQVKQYLHHQRDIVRSMQASLQKQQSAWRQAKGRYDDKFRAASSRASGLSQSPAAHKRFERLKQRKSQLDSSARALNEDVRQLKSIQKWVDGKEMRLSEFSRYVRQQGGDVIARNGRAIAPFRPYQTVGAKPTMLAVTDLDDKWRDYVSSGADVTLTSPAVIDAAVVSENADVTAAASAAVAAANARQSMVASSGRGLMPPPRNRSPSKSLPGGVITKPHADTAAQVDVLQKMVQRWAQEHSGLKGSLRKHYAWLNDFRDKIRDASNRLASSADGRHVSAVVGGPASRVADRDIVIRINAASLGL